VDLSRYTALFLTESREQLAACGQALLEWERVPDAQDPVVGLFRSMHTFKGMAAAMGYANLTELAPPRPLLDQLRSDPGSGAKWISCSFASSMPWNRTSNGRWEGGDAGLDSAAGRGARPGGRESLTGSWAIPRPEAPAPGPVAGARGAGHDRPAAS
jgi:hypothetical protein